jgi:hypothetical protein
MDVTRKKKMIELEGKRTGRRRTGGSREKTRKYGWKIEFGRRQSQRGEWGEVRREGYESEMGEERRRDAGPQGRGE